MKTQTPKILTSLCAIVIIGSMANLAQAENSKDKETKELQLFSQASISLQDAIKAAEEKTGGKAMEAEINDESTTVQFEIEVLKDGKVHEVMVDGKTGKVLKVSLEDESKETSENEKD
ncbi:MAG: PepSY domain-containing protein [Methylobacter sp.]|nr:PepSY domain-containing protein [Methylobacter sp.]